jgi:hypothetical protein
LEIETAGPDNKAAIKYRLAPETNFPESVHTAVVRSVSGKLYNNTI